MLSQMLVSLQNQIPVEFQRTTKDLSDVHKWKATEFRFFLLYSGPVVLKNCLTIEQYQHFLLLSAACRILFSDKAIIFNDKAKFFLEKFVTISKDIYGLQSIVLNMHSLIHLADNVNYFQDYLSNFTAFLFEIMLGKIKKTFHKWTTNSRVSSFTSYSSN